MYDFHEVLHCFDCGWSEGGGDRNGNTTRNNCSPLYIAIIIPCCVLFFLWLFDGMYMLFYCSSPMFVLLLCFLLVGCSFLVGKRMRTVTTAKISRPAMTICVLLLDGLCFVLPIFDVHPPRQLLQKKKVWSEQQSLSPSISVCLIDCCILLLLYHLKHHPFTKTRCG